MVICPVDGEAEIEEGESPCHQCGADLSAFWRMRELPDVYYNEGLDLAKKGLLDEAIEKLVAAIALNPKSVESYIVLGKLYAQKGLHDKALVQWEKTLEIDAENEDVKEGKEKIKRMKLAKDRTTLGSAESKKIFEGFRNFWYNIDYVNYLGFLTFMSGIILFPITVFYSRISQLNLLDPQRTCNILTMAGIGPFLMIVGINIFLGRKKTDIYIITFWGSMLSLVGISVFYLQYARGWYYPLAGYVDFLYAIGILMLIGNIFANGIKDWRERDENKDNTLF